MSAADNLLTNINKVAYTTFYDTEKVVKTFDGSYTYGTSTTTRNYTLAGSPNNQQVFIIEHGFTRPVFVELLWSLDNEDFQVGGANLDASGFFGIAFSDSTYIYIMTSALTSGTPVYYKLICSWISDYDTTNPTIGPFLETPATFAKVFNSEAIIPPVVKSGTLALDTTSGTLTDVVGTVLHGLAYTPNFRVFIESFSGEVWPLNYGGTLNPYLVDDNQVEAQAFSTTTQFVGDMILKSSLGTRKMWYLIYGNIADVL